jgi:predicted secreted protein
VKMRETSNIVAIVKTDAGHFVAKQSVKVTAGGCV